MRRAIKSTTTSNQTKASGLSSFILIISRLCTECGSHLDYNGSFYANIAMPTYSAIRRSSSIIPKQYETPADTIWNQKSAFSMMHFIETLITQVISHQDWLLKPYPHQLLFEQSPICRVVVTTRHMALPSCSFVKDMTTLLCHIWRSVYCRVAGQLLRQVSSAG